MIKMVEVHRRSVAFCKYTIALLLWLGLIFSSMIPVFIVFAVMLVSAVTGVQKAPLVLLFDKTAGRFLKAKKEYINLYSMRFAHVTGCVFCILCGIFFYLLPYPFFAVLLTVFALLQTIASFGYCSAAKLYECVVCNSNCCRFGKKIRSIKHDAR